MFFSYLDFDYAAFIFSLNSLLNKISRKGEKENRGKIK